jgi:hypothetical protein
MWNTTPVSARWIPLTVDLPPDGKMVMTKIDDADGVRNEQSLVRQGNLWFADEMYVYYRPTHWRELTQEELFKEKQRNEAKISALKEKYKRELA